MLSASRSLGRPQLSVLPGWRTVVLATLALLLSLVIARSTVEANWVTGVDVLVPVTLVAAAVLGALALLRFLPWPVALAAGLLPAPVVAYVFTAGALHAAHPSDPAYSLNLISIWLNRVSSAPGATDEVFYLFVLAMLFWVVGGWLMWCVLRWRQPLLGLVPGAAAFATNILNYPSNQNGYTLAFLVLTLLLLLWTSYQRSLEHAARSRLRLSSDARWDFWETGIVVMAVVVAIGIFLPPVSFSDRTVDIENGTFRGWADLNQQLNHPVAFGHGVSTGTSVGFVDNVPLAGSIHRTGGVVFTYQIDGTYNGPRYFRGLNEVRTQVVSGQATWRYASDGSVRQVVTHNSEPVYAESYDLQTVGNFKIQMLKPPGSATDVLFYPGQLIKTDRDAIAISSQGYGASAPLDKLYTIDRLSGAGRAGGSGAYTVQVSASTATEEQLRNAGTEYPTWLDPYRNFSTVYRTPAQPDPAKVTSPGVAPYRPPATIAKIRDLAQRVTEGKSNPYDQASAIESYLRSNYVYNTNVADPPRDVDPLEFFLFDTKTGYCEYFASAMGDMLRALGIPTRLVNGYGPGTYDDKLQRYVVKESDAHTWVEAYFPKYGWIPFEPTSDGVYFPIARGSSGSAECTRDSEICGPNAGVTDSAGTTDPTHVDKGGLDPGLGGEGGGVGPLGVPPAIPISLGALLLVALVVFAAINRYLRPRTAGGVWKRITLLCRLAGLQGSLGETPLEFSRRISDEFPETAKPMRQLAEHYVVAAYAPPERAGGTRSRILEQWAELRPLLVGRVRGRLGLAS